jgi:DNA-binding CsgD family transcriptional regulator
MKAFARRARHELLSTGEKVRTRQPNARDGLTVQEAQIAGLARDGLANGEIGARLFLSPRTVEWHLRSAPAVGGDHGRAAHLQRFGTSSSDAEPPASDRARHRR